MRVDLRTHETLTLIFGLAGLVEQEAARLLLNAEPSQLMTAAFLALTGFGSIPPVLRGARQMKDRRESEDEQ